MNQSTTAHQIFRWRLRNAFDLLLASLTERQIPDSLQYAPSFPMQARDFVKFAITEEIRAALYVAMEILGARGVDSAEKLLADIGQGRRGQGLANEMGLYHNWIERMLQQDADELEEPKPRLCWPDIEVLFDSVWRELGMANDMLKLSSDGKGNYQVALAVVIFEYTMRHRMAVILPLAMVSTTWRDPWLAVLLARYNQVSPVERRLSWWNHIWLVRRFLLFRNRVAIV
jgi:hypothetical protein